MHIYERTMKFTECLDAIKFQPYKNKRFVVSTHEDSTMKMQLPRMYMPFGINAWTPEVGPPKYNIDFAMNGWDEDENYVKKFYDTIVALENKVLEHVTEHSEEIFGKKMEKDELFPLFNSNIKEGGNGYAPKFRVKVDATTTDLVKADVFDPEKNRLTDTIENGLYSRNSGRALVEIASVYFLNKKFGVTYKLSQLMVYPPERLKGFAFDLSDD
jgi:hypothetical protein